MHRRATAGLIPVLSVLAVVTASSYAGQVLSSVRKSGFSSGGVSLDVVANSPEYLAPPTPLALRVANDAFTAVWGPNGPHIELFSAPAMEPNAFFGYVTVSYRQSPSGPMPVQKAAVVYSPSFLDEVQSDFGQAAVLALFAHETGHGMSRYFKWDQYNFESHQEERRADFIAGFGLARWRADPAGIEACMKAFATYDDGSHPKWDVRIGDIRAGWLAGGGLPFWLDAGREDDTLRWLEMGRRHGQSDGGGARVETTKEAVITGDEAYEETFTLNLQEGSGVDGKVLTRVFRYGDCEFRLRLKPELEYLSFPQFAHDPCHAFKIRGPDLSAAGTIKPAFLRISVWSHRVKRWDHGSGAASNKCALPNQSEVSAKLTLVDVETSPYRVPRIYPGDQDLTQYDLTSAKFLLSVKVTSAKPAPSDAAVPAAPAAPPTDYDRTRLEPGQSTLSGEMRYLGNNGKGFEEYLWLKDSSVVVRIPAGTFTKGSNDGNADEKPPHHVYLPDYYIDKCEVTNLQYERFCAATDRPEPPDPGFSGMPGYFENYPNYPVVNVNWDDIQAYCRWAGKRLPTEAEWEKAARGIDARKFPWGDELPSAGGRFRCNYDCYDSTDGTDGVVYRADGYEYTAPVGRFERGKSPYGCMDMAGNVWEWMSDRYSNTDYVARSGAWRFGCWYMRCAFRSAFAPLTRRDDLGFRCAVTR
ncbi:MAG: SUMF1/EgtB/PvdO family nonheme iron enzyme [candidate division WOR-3 bacterium]|nr:SUMF1/EgtB/PvdO family nonheme iron enzyme [candidate division WOR-3 bacterium]